LHYFIGCIKIIFSIFTYTLLRQSWNHLFNIRLYQMIDGDSYIHLIAIITILSKNSLFIWHILYILNYRYWYPYMLILILK
jgi:hypothetical protein